MARHALGQRMDVEIAKAPGEILVPVGRQVLVAEEQHQMIEEGVVDFRERLAVELISETDVKNFGAEGTGHGLDVDSAIVLAHRHLVYRAACLRVPDLNRLISSRPACTGYKAISNLDVWL